VSGTPLYSGGRWWRLPESPRGAGSFRPASGWIERSTSAPDAVGVRTGLVRSITGRHTGPVLHGHFARFNSWTTIGSAREGKFKERIAPGAFSETFTRDRDRIRVLFNHGRDPFIGDKPLGPLEDLREDGDIGGFYAVPLLNADYVNALVPGLQAGLYGASFRFSVQRQRIDQRPARSEHNPDGLPERTIHSARVRELGPVTFPHTATRPRRWRCQHPQLAASAGRRSLRHQPGSWVIR